MPWPTIEIDSWQKFSTLAERLILGRPQHALYVMRGQADSAWGLTPSLLRLFPENVTTEQAISVEQASVREFQAQAHLHLAAALLPNTFPQPSLTEWWALMQHHHAPTRLLDWTRSPYVAAYFAVEQELDKAGAVFVVHVRTSVTKFLAAFPGGKVEDEQMENLQAPHALMYWEPMKKSERYVAQQGYFSLNVNILGAHDQIIEEQCATANQAAPQRMFHEKWVIPARLKLEFLRKLRVMNIAAHSLFPGIDGLGRSLGEVARLAAVEEKNSV